MTKEFISVLSEHLEPSQLETDMTDTTFTGGSKSTYDGADTEYDDVDTAA